MASVTTPRTDNYGFQYETTLDELAREQSTGGESDVSQHAPARNGRRRDRYPHRALLLDRNADRRLVEMSEDEGGFYCSDVSPDTVTELWANERTMQVAHDDHGAFFLAADLDGAEALTEILSILATWIDGDPRRYHQESAEDVERMASLVASLIR